MSRLTGILWMLYEYIKRPHYLPNVSLGKNVTFPPENYSSLCAGNGHIVIGDRCSINVGVIIDANFYSRIVLGNNVMVGPYAVIIASSHNYNRCDIPIHDQGHKAGQIIIKDDVWIGAHAVILPDVIVGEGVVIGAGAVVSHDVEPFTVVGGVPAHFIKGRR